MAFRARKRPNLVALLALQLARDGLPVLIHGLEEDPGRVTTAGMSIGVFVMRKMINFDF